MRIPVCEPYMNEKEIEYVTKALRRIDVARGPELEEFEKKLAEFIGVKYAVSLSSGSDALELAFRCLDIKNKEVITSATSCSPSANGILRSGNKPVFVDVLPNNFTMDPDKIEAAITENTAAIMPIHIYGRPSRMDRIMQISKKYKLPIIEDCAQSMGAKFDRVMTGAIGNIGCFSLNINKIITTGEGGFITTNDENIAKKAKILRNYGRDIEKTDYNYTLFGGNFKLTNMHAAFGLAQMEKINEILCKRRQNGQYYLEKLKKLKKFIYLPSEQDKEHSVYFCMPVLLKIKGIRDALSSFLAKKGIENRNMFRPMCDQPYYKEQFDSEKKILPVAEYAGENGLYVSCSPTLKKEDIDYIISSIEEGINEFCRS